MLSAFMRSFINDAELCCEHVGQQAALLWVGASRCPLLPRKRGFRAVPSALLLGCPRCRMVSDKDRGSYGAGYVKS